MKSMSSFTRRFPLEFLLLVFFSCMFLLYGCSSSDEKAIYDGAKPAKPLEAPPDLVVPKAGVDDIPVIASPAATYSGYHSGKDDEAGQGLSQLPAGVRLERDGAIRWLEIDAPVEKVWKSAKQFLSGLGFELTIVDRRLGIMETNWLENRADVPSNWLSRLLKNVYSSGLLDRYRIRIEKDGENRVLVFITHQGLREVVSGDNSEQVVTEGWERREPDPQLEMEMLQRFAVSMGVGAKTAEKLVQGDENPESRTQLHEQDGKLWLEVKENFPRTWRRTNLALDHLGLIVEDRDRSNGKYYIRVPDKFQEDDKGWFANLFSSKEKIKENFVVGVRDDNGSTRIEILDRENHLESGAIPKRLLGEFAKLLR